jgi:hypothetical protein
MNKFKALGSFKSSSLYSCILRVIHLSYIDTRLYYLCVLKFMPNLVPVMNFEKYWYKYQFKYYIYDFNKLQASPKVLESFIEIYQDYNS